MTLIRLAMTMTCLLLTTSLLRAEDKPPAGGPPMPTPAPELTAFMKAFEGNWKCDTKFFAGAMGPGSPEMSAKSTVKIKKDLKGFWYVGIYELSKTKAMPGMKGSFNIGYDPATKQLVSLSLDDMGGMSDEKGPIQGDSAVLTGEALMMGQKSKMRETMMKKSDKGIVHKMEVDMGKGFQPMGEDTCKK